MTWRDRCSTEGVRRQCGEGVDVIIQVKRNLLLWYGHKEETESGRMGKKVYKSEAKGERNHGELR